MKHPYLVKDPKFLVYVFGVKYNPVQIVKIFVTVFLQMVAYLPLKCELVKFEFRKYQKYYFQNFLLFSYLLFAIIMKIEMYLM